MEDFRLRGQSVTSPYPAPCASFEKIYLVTVAPRLNIYSSTSLCRHDMSRAVAAAYLRVSMSTCLACATRLPEFAPQAPVSMEAEDKRKQYDTRFACSIASEHKAVCRTGQSVLLRHHDSTPYIHVQFVAPHLTHRAVGAYLHTFEGTTRVLQRESILAVQ